jgi:hypothetical protein
LVIAANEPRSYHLTKTRRDALEKRCVLQLRHADALSASFANSTPYIEVSNARQLHN